MTDTARIIAEASMVCHQSGYHDLGQGLDEVVAPALRARLSQAGAGGGVVVVKPLVWTERTSLHHVAETPFGSYSAYVDGGWSGPASTGNAGGGFHEGRSAAQADYQALILSALATPPATPVQPTASDQTRFDAAIAAYWAAEGTTIDGIRAAIVSWEQSR